MKEKREETMYNTLTCKTILLLFILLKFIIIRLSDYPLNIQSTTTRTIISLHLKLNLF